MPKPPAPRALGLLRLAQLVERACLQQPRADLGAGKIVGRITGNDIGEQPLGLFRIAFVDGDFGLDMGELEGLEALRIARHEFLGPSQCGVRCFAIAGCALDPRRLERRQKTRAARGVRQHGRDLVEAPACPVDLAGCDERLHQVHGRARPLRQAEIDAAHAEGEREEQLRPARAADLRLEAAALHER